ncbi:MAG TPA: BON domain-containing protein [Candidatus Acidoferrales bacterium]|nr:BON domain-containing protein [Candidatus Acidoferrales bacterium]
MQIRRLGHLPLASLLVLVLFMGCASKSNDAQLTTNLKAQMFSDPQTKNANLQISVKDGVATLSGTAPSDASRYEAYKLAASTPGVSKVDDEMTVQAPQQAAQAAPPAAPAPVVEAAPPKKPRHVRKAAQRARVKHRPRHVATESAKQTPSEQTAPRSTMPVSPAPATTPQAAESAASASQPAPVATPAPAPPKPETAVFPTGTTVEVQTVDSIDSKTAQAGDEFQATLAQPLTWNSRVIVPKGANVYLRLVAAQTSGQYKGRSQLQLTLVRVEVQGANYPLTSTTYTEAGGSRGSDTAKTVGGGAIVGAIIGAIAGGGKGAAIGGAAGAGAGGVYQGVTKAKQVRVPAETRLDFKLDQPLNIPVTPTNTAQ